MESGQVETEDQGIRSADSQGQLASAPEAIIANTDHHIMAFNVISGRPSGMLYFVSPLLEY